MLTPTNATRPLISVVIPTCDRPLLLDEALASVAAQEVPGDVEAVVVNDGFQDVAEVVERWRNVMPVTLVELNRREGPAAARNAGITRVTGTYVAFLDDDDLFLPDHLDAGLGVLERDEAEFVYLGALVSEKRVSADRSVPAGSRTKSYPYDHRLLLVANFIHTSAVITRNFRATEVRFDESLRVCEDWDLWLSLTIALRYRVSYIDRITSVYHQLAEAPGMVANAQLESPSRFSVARTRIYDKWPSPDPLVGAYRDWMVTLEKFRDDLISDGRKMPNLLFDRVLAYLYAQMSSGAPPEYGDIESLFDPD